MLLPLSFFVTVSFFLITIRGIVKHRHTKMGTREEKCDAGMATITSFLVFTSVFLAFNKVSVASILVSMYIMMAIYSILLLIWLGVRRKS